MFANSAIVVFGALRVKNDYFVPHMISSVSKFNTIYLNDPMNIIIFGVVLTLKHKMCTQKVIHKLSQSQQKCLSELALIIQLILDAKKNNCCTCS